MFRVCGLITVLGLCAGPALLACAGDPLGLGPGAHGEWGFSDVYMKEETGGVVC